MTVVDVTGGVSGCCQVTVVLVKLSILTPVTFAEQDGGPKWKCSTLLLSTFKTIML